MIDPLVIRQEQRSYETGMFQITSDNDDDDIDANDDDDIDTNDSPAFLLKPITRNVSTISSPESPFSSPSSPVQCLCYQLMIISGWITN